jgi:hypothetical protein
MQTKPPSPFKRYRKSTDGVAFGELAQSILYKFRTEFFQARKRPSCCLMGALFNDPAALLFHLFFKIFVKDHDHGLVWSKECSSRPFLNASFHICWPRMQNQSHLKFTVMQANQYG